MRKNYWDLYQFAQRKLLKNQKQSINRKIIINPNQLQKQKMKEPKTKDKQRRRNKKEMKEQKRQEDCSEKRRKCCLAIL